MGNPTRGGAASVKQRGAAGNPLDAVVGGVGGPAPGGSGFRLRPHCSLLRVVGAHFTSWRFWYSPLVRSVTVTGWRPRLRQNHPCIPSNAATSTPSSEGWAVPLA
jgi:hypothetical protein